MAKTDGKIYITISDRRIGEGGGETPDTPQTQKDDEKKKDLLGDFLKHKFYNLVQEQAKQMGRYTLANIGNFTGDYQYQREMNVAMDVLGEAVNLVSAFTTGTMATGGNVIGGAVAVAITVASQTINFALQESANRVSNRTQNYNIQQLRDISGLNALTNGSR